MLCFRGSVQLQGALINGIESRLTEVEGRLSDLDARGSEEHDNLANERDLNRFILSGEFRSLIISVVICRTLEKLSLMSINHILTYRVAKICKQLLCFHVQAYIKFLFNYRSTEACECRATSSYQDCWESYVR